MIKKLALVLLLFSAFNGLSQDWAQLNRYMDANRELGKPKNGEFRIVFMGNSITEGWNNVKPGIFDTPTYINRGIGGQTTGQMKARFQQDVIDLQPKKVIILAGINDIAQNQGFVAITEIAQNIRDMADMAMNANIEVVICSVLPANYFPWRPQILPADMVIELNALLKSHALETGCKYLDYYSEMVNDEKGMQTAFTYDGVHCTEAGYRKMEEIIKKIL